MSDPDGADLAQTAIAIDQRQKPIIRTLPNDLRTMPERISNISASDIVILNRAADLIEQKT